MWDPQLGPGDIGLGIAAFVWGYSKIRDRLDGGTTRERLVRIEANQASFKEELIDVKKKVERLEDLKMEGR